MMNAAPENLQGVFDRTFAGISHARDAFTPQLTPREVGTITNVSMGIARVSSVAYIAPDTATSICFLTADFADFADGKGSSLLLDFHESPPLFMSMAFCICF